MDAVWYGIADLMEWIFELVKPLGRLTNILFITIGAVGTVFWLYYGEKTRKGGNNFLAEHVKEKSEK